MRCHVWLQGDGVEPRLHSSMSELTGIQRRQVLGFLRHSIRVHRYLPEALQLKLPMEYAHESGAVEHHCMLYVIWHVACCKTIAQRVRW